ncbi:MAG TPA: hypothetical protein VGI79_09785 [Caulobacteraceae bacterium]
MSFTRSATLNFLRIRVVAGLVSGLGGLFAGMLFLSALFLHSHVLGIAALVALAFGLLGIAVTQGWRAYLLFNPGSWTTLGGRPTSRSEQPARFVTWVTLHGLLAATYSTAAGYMIWIAIFPGR